jgi:outer membrane protein OmpA-like peptidoglycan-associated protein
MGSAPQPSPGLSGARSPMADTTKSRPANEPGDESSSNGSGPLEELRHLILAPEQEALERLHERIADPESRTNDVSGVVAEAIHRRREQGGGDALSEALAPTIETALRESVRKDPATLADALFPVMGPAIRRSILETLRSFLDSFNQILDQSLSWQGLKWRFEAMRTGRSFTEVALLHSLVFRVEQVFLIHKKTGLPVAHAVAPAVAMQDPSLVSGMLSAIQDFVRDSFHTGQGQGVNRMNVGDLDVWVEDGPYAILAAVIRGVAPRAVHDRMAETLEKIHAEYAAQLDRFDGDNAPFADVNKELSRCLESKFKEESQSRGYGYALAAFLVLLAIFGAWVGWRWWQYHRWSELAITLGNQPGLTITYFDREHGQFVIRGLRDPLAPDPRKFIDDAHLDSSQAEFHWGSYYALDDALLQQRAVAALAPPAGVQLSVKDGVLQVNGDGQPSAKWLSDLRARALLIPGIRSVDFGRFTPEQIAFDEAKNRIQATVIMFPLASAALSSAELANIRNLLPQFQQLLSASGTLHESVKIEVVGHSDATGAESANQNLSQRRADRIAWQLAQFHISDATLHAKGVATTEPVRPEDTEENRKFNRSATFRVLASPAGQP